MGKALDAEERLHVCFIINASIISVKHFACDLFHFRYLFKMRCNSLKCVIIFVVTKQVLCHYFNELSFLSCTKKCILFRTNTSIIYCNTALRIFTVLLSILFICMCPEAGTALSLPQLRIASICSGLV